MLDKFQRHQALFVDTIFGRILSQHPIVCVDIGSRGGVEADLLPISFAVDALGFEPDPEEYAALAERPSGPWRSLRYLPFAVAGSDGPRTLNVPVDPNGASLLQHDERIGERFNKRQFFERRQSVAVETRALDAVLAEAEKWPAFLKLDVEGLELEILSSSPRALESTLALKVEASFIPFRHDQPLMFDIHNFLSTQGFVLMDIIRPNHWRTNGHVIHPFATRQKIPYSRGQLVQADLLYVRTAERINEPERLFQSAALAMIYGFFDHAESILRMQVMVDWLTQNHRADAGDLLDEASRKYGLAIWRAEFSQHLRRIWTFLRSYRALTAS